MIPTLQDHFELVYPLVKEKLPAGHFIIKGYVQGLPALFITDTVINETYLTQELIESFSLLTVVEGIVTIDKNKLFGVGYDLLNPVISCTCGHSSVDSSRHEFYCDIVRNSGPSIY